MDFWTGYSTWSIISEGFISLLYVDTKILVADPPELQQSQFKVESE